MENAHVHFKSIVFAMLLCNQNIMLLLRIKIISDMEIRYVSMKKVKKRENGFLK